MPSNIRAFKLVNGDEIVAEVIETFSSPQVLMESAGTTTPPASFMVRRPHVLRFLQQGGTANLAFVPWTLSNPLIDSVLLPSSAILLVFEPAQHVENQYLSQTSGIEIMKPTTRIST